MYATLVASVSAEDLAQSLLSSTNVSGGLIVHVGCGDGRLTAALRASEQYLVHGLDADPANVEKARQHIRSCGLYGPVSVDVLPGAQLPYADNLVNLVVVSGARVVQVSTDEILRVLRSRRRRRHTRS